MFNVTKDPDAVLDYKWDFAPLTNGSDDPDVEDWLSTGEVVNTFTLTPSDAAIVIDSSLLSDSDTSVTAWISGGVADTVYQVKCHIVTDNTPARKEDRTIVVYVEDR